MLIWLHMNRWLVSITLFFNAAWCNIALAHPEGFSGLTVNITEEGVGASLTLHTRDFGAWFPAHRYPDYVREVSRELEASAADLVELTWNDQPLPMWSAKASSPEVGLIQLDITFLQQLSEKGVLGVRSMHLNRMPRGHQQIVRIEDGRHSRVGLAQGRILREATFALEEDFCTADVPVIEKKSTVPAAPPPTNARASGMVWWIAGGTSVMVVIGLLWFIRGRWFTRTRELRCEVAG